MKKLLFFVLIIILHASNFAYGQKVNQIIKKERGVLYVVDRGWDYVVNTNVITVKLISHNSVIDPTLKVLNIDPSGYIDIQVPQGKDIQEFVEELKQSKQFESVEYNTYGTLCMTPNDTYYSQQSYLDTINAPSAWDITTGNPNIKVAVIDTGIEVAHSDIGYGSNTYSNVSLTEGVNYTNESNTHISPVNSHGTNVAGIIGAKTNNSKGIAGICGGNNSSGVTMIPYCVTNSEPISNINVRAAIYDAINAGVKVINMSLRLSEDDATNACIEYAYNHNVCIVCSAGNNENGGNTGIYYPASHSKTIAVGATTSTNVRWGDSQYGQGLDLVAPGVTIKTTDINNSYTNLYSGTSLSAPQVTGTIALMLSVNPSLTPYEIKSILHNTCTKLTGYTYDSSGWNEEVGYGLLNVKDAVAAVAFKIIGPSLVCTDTPYYIENLPAGMSVVWTLENLYGGFVFHTDTPSTNQCTLSKVGGDFHATLKASIYYNNSLFATATKYVYSLSSSYGTYSQESCWYYNVQHPAITTKNLKTGEAMFVHQGCWVTLHSNYFEKATVSHSGATPDIWFFDRQNKTLIFSLPLYSGGIPFMIDVDNDNSCGDVRFTFFSVTNNGNITSSSLNVEPETNGYLISVTRANNSDGSVVSNSLIKENWELEIYSANWGTKKLGCVVNENKYLLNTTGWDAGIYVIRAVVNGEVYTEKITVK